MSKTEGCGTEKRKRSGEERRGEGGDVENLEGFSSQLKFTNCSLSKIYSAVMDSHFIDC